MGCSGSSLAGDKAELLKNRTIESTQKAAQKAAQLEVKILLIGTGDSGKTTIRKQLLNLHGARFKDEAYRQTFCSSIVENLLDGTQAIIASLDTDKYSDIAEMLKSAMNSSPSFLDPNVAAVITDLNTNDKVFMNIRDEKAGEIHLQACYKVFVEELKSFPAWGGKGWVPNVDDCVRARVRTTGIVKETVDIDGMKYSIIDVGGQRAERRKWIHSFEDSTAALFVTSLSEYDQNLFEDNSKNRLEEAFDLFRSCIESQWLNKATFILFLNKKDLFDEKFMKRRIPLNVTGKFPTAPSVFDVDQAIEWITSEFKQRTKRKDVYVHVTTATDPRNVKTVFDTCKAVLTKAAMCAAGFII